MQLGLKLHDFGERTAIALGSVSFLVVGFLLDIATVQELVVAILYNVPIALSGLSSSRRLTLYTVFGALTVNLVAGVFNALGGLDAVAILNRLMATLSFLLVGFLTRALRQRSAQVSRLQAGETQAEREHLLHALGDALSSSRTPAALLQRAAEVLREHLAAEAVVISGLERSRFHAPQYSAPLTAALKHAPLGESTSWLLALADGQDPPVAAGLDDTRPLLVGRVREPHHLAVLAVGAKAPAVTGKSYLGDAVRELGKLLERAELLASLERQRTELERQNGVIRDLVYAFSHDLRTPLIANAMNMRLALEGAYGELSADYQSVLNNGLSANEDLLELADSLLLVARFESGEPPGETDAVEFRGLLEESVARLYPVLSDKDVRVTLHAPTELSILGRAAELRRVVQNLLDNAVKFSPEGGSVSVALQRDEESLSAQGVTLSVCDSGPGVPEALLPHLFERFSHGKAGGGSGLGLYLAQQLVAGHGGTLRYTPRPEGGSCFSVWLPVALEAISV